MKKKLKDLEETNKSVEPEMTALKLKLKEAKGQIHSDWLRGSRAGEITNQASHHEKMKKYLEEKEMQIARKVKSKGNLVKRAERNPKQD